MSDWNEGRSRLVRPSPGERQAWRTQDADFVLGRKGPTGSLSHLRVPPAARLPLQRGIGGDGEALLFVARSPPAGAFWKQSAVSPQGPHAGARIRRGEGGDCGDHSHALPLPAPGLKRKKPRTPGVSSVPAGLGRSVTLHCERLPDV